MSERFGRRRSRPTKVAELVAAFVAKESGHDAGERKRGALTMRVFTAFETLGPPFVHHAEPAQFRAGVLTLVVDESTWLTELTFLAPELIARLNRALPREAVKELRLRLGKLSPRRAQKTPAEPPKVSAENAARIESWAQMIGEPETREAMRRAARWALRKKT